MQPLRGLKWAGLTFLGAIVVILVLSAIAGAGSPDPYEAGRRVGFVVGALLVPAMIVAFLLGMFGAKLFWLVVLGVPLTIGAIGLMMSGPKEKQVAYAPPPPRGVVEPPPPPPMGAVYVKSEPAGAMIKANAGRSGSTPSLVRAPIGASMEVEVKLEGYVPQKFKTVVGAETTTLAATLEVARTINVTSEPSDAEITIDGVSFGRTPATIEVPAKRPVALMIEKPGFRAFVQKLRKQKRIAARLKPLPLSKLDLSPSERAELKALKAAVASANKRYAKAKMRLNAAKISAGRASGAVARVKADNLVQDTEQAFYEAEGDLEGARGELSGFESSVRNR